MAGKFRPRDPEEWEIVGYTMGFRHWRTGKWVTRKDGGVIPIWKRRKK